MPGRYSWLEVVMGTMTISASCPWNLSTVSALDGLAQLHLVPEQHDIFGTHAHGNYIGQRDLAGFIHKQVVKPLVIALVCKEPGRAAQQVHRIIHGIFVAGHVHDDGPVQAGVFAGMAAFFDAGKCDVLFVCVLFNAREQIVDGFIVS
jgi:hypothetical protein